MKLRIASVEIIAKRAIFALVLLSVSAGAVCPSRANEAKPLEWHTLNTNEIGRTILDNKALSDGERAIAMTRYLDECVTLAPLTPLEILHTTDWEVRKMQPGNGYAWLIDVMGRRDGKALPEAVSQAITKLDTLPDIKNKRAVRSLLYVALNLAGGDAPEDELLRLLNDPETTSQVVYRILGGMLRSRRPTVGATALQPLADDLPWLVDTPDLPARVPARALPRLLELADHPWSYLTGSDVVHDDKPRNRVYPIRELVYACLLELDVQAEKVTVAATGKNQDGDPQNFITQIKVNRASADKKLRELKSGQTSPK